MGWAADAWLAGLITDEQYDWLKEHGEEIHDTYDTELLQDFMQMLHAIGMDEFADEIEAYMWDSEAYWAGVWYSAYGEFIYFDEESSHWRNADTGAFTVDPYAYFGYY